MDIKITKKNGESFTFEQYGIIVKDFNVSSIPLNSSYAQPEGMDKQVDYGATYEARSITVPFVILAKNLHDYPLLRDFLFAKVNDKDSYYIQEIRRTEYLSYAFVDTQAAPKMSEGTGNRLVSGKRYLVRLQNVFELEQMLTYGEGELVFETTILPFAESAATTQDIERNGINANNELWGFGMGLQSLDETLKYTHSARHFRIFNAGNVPIHPFEQDLKITISGAKGSSSYLQLRNNTNGTVFRINESVTQSQTVVVDGATVTINNLQSLRKTNRTYISLETGWNDFTLSGADEAKVSFDFPFYYL